MTLSLLKPEGTLDEFAEGEDEDKDFDGAEPNGKLSDEYNPDDELDEAAFGYGWSYQETLDSPEEVEKEEEFFDEDAEYAQGKPVGYDLDRDGEDEEDD